MELSGRLGSTLLLLQQSYTTRFSTATMYIVVAVYGIQYLTVAAAFAAGIAVVATVRRFHRWRSSSFIVVRCSNRACPKRGGRMRKRFVRTSRLSGGIRAARAKSVSRKNNWARFKRVSQVLGVIQQHPARERDNDDAIIVLIDVSNESVTGGGGGSVHDSQKIARLML